MRTTYDPKPIPDRRFDWVATEDDYEPGRPIGYGATEAEAVADLSQELEAETMNDIEAVKLARIYGLLWNCRVDRTTFSGMATSEARKLALSMLTKEQRAAGIEWANKNLVPMVEREGAEWT